MNRELDRIPTLITIAACALMIAHGPIAQLPHYHDFADHTFRFGIPHAADVLSNIGFALIGLWGWAVLRPMRDHPALREAWPGYRIFLMGLMLTALGSGFYHLAPDNYRLIWDRLPIALACAGLLAAVRAETVHTSDAHRDAALLSLFAVASVAWWSITDRLGVGDLRPYLLLQGLPLILIPLWQTIHRAPRQDRLWFGAALLLYVLAKATELHDHEILTMTGWITGHTIKHALATAAAGAIVWRLGQRVYDTGDTGSQHVTIALPTIPAFDAESTYD
jgi:hypothetical protein